MFVKNQIKGFQRRNIARKTEFVEVNGFVGVTKRPGVLGAIGKETEVSLGRGAQERKMAKTKGASGEIP